ncbi:MAG: hypothetical protein ACKPJJ_01845, partial [Planctomycetaceae bacterium]
MPAAERGEVQKYLAEKFSGTLTIVDADIDGALTDSERELIRANADQRAALLTQKKSYGVIQALWDVGPPPVSHVHRRGNVKAHGVLVQPGFPEILQPALSGGPASGNALPFAVQRATRPTDLPDA